MKIKYRLAENGCSLTLCPYKNHTLVGEGCKDCDSFWKISKKNQYVICHYDSEAFKSFKKIFW